MLSFLGIHRTYCWSLSCSSGVATASHEHFIDLCRMLGVATPNEADPTGDWYAFEKGAEKTGGGDDFADVWKRGYFGWEYKGKRNRRGAECGLEHNRGVTAGGDCNGCGISFDRAAAAFQFQTLDGPILKCARCALRHRPMLKRSTAVALVVGTVLMIINQGDVLLGAKWPGALIWKVPLTYLVPFVVATWGALVNGRVRG